MLRSSSSSSGRSRQLNRKHPTPTAETGTTTSRLRRATLCDVTPVTTRSDLHHSPPGSVALRLNCCSLRSAMRLDFSLEIQ
jgi:hypothetical protein